MRSGLLRNTLIQNELLISQEIIFAFTVNYWIITPPINFMRSNTCNLFHTRTHEFITNQLFTEKLFPYLKFTHVLLIYIFSPLFAVIFVIFVTFKQCYLSCRNNSGSNYCCRLKYMSWLFSAFILTSVTASTIPQ